MLNSPPYDDIPDMPCDLHRDLEAAAVFARRALEAEKLLTDVLDESQHHDSHVSDQTIKKIVEHLHKQETA